MPVDPTTHWPDGVTRCCIQPCGALAVTPGPMCWAHWSIIPRPHQRAIKHALAAGTDDSLRDAIMAATGRVQETVNRLAAAIERVETPR